MRDRFGREISYLRVSVTDRCNLRCVYCMPPEGVPPICHSDILSFEEILEVVREAISMGVRKVRLTGGEPLVRKGIVQLVAALAHLDGVEDFGMTTNGTFLAKYAEALAEAGLHRVNVSLDATKPQAYARITRGGDVATVFAGIAAARAAGLDPIKLNCVIKDSPDEADAQDVTAYAAAEGLEARFIRRMNLASGSFSTVIGGSGGDCPHCNRLRLSSSGDIRPCLFSDLAYNVRELGASEALRQAIDTKPKSGCTSQGHIHAIGG